MNLLRAGPMSLIIFGLAGWPTIGASHSLTPREGLRALADASDHHGPPNMDLAPMLASEHDITPTMAIDVTSHGDVFTRIDRLNGVTDIALLKDGRIARWILELTTNASGVQYPGKLKGVVIGKTPEDVGYDKSFRIRGKGPSPPRNVPCDPIDVAEVRSSSLKFTYIAACQNRSPKGGTNIVLFDLSGRYEVAAYHPLSISRISMDWGMHGGRGRLGLVTAPDIKGRIYLQQYRW